MIMMKIMMRITTDCGISIADSCGNDLGIINMSSGVTSSVEAR